MSRSNFAKFFKLIRRFRAILWIGAIIFVITLAGSLWIFYHYSGDPKEDYWFHIAEILQNIAETLFTTVLIGGGIGGMVNFIIEEQKQEEEAVKERWERMQASSERRKNFRAELRQRLQHAHDQVELARILIKSHRSGKTYGEQIREHVMPANIALQDIKNQLNEITGERPIEHMPELQVSLTYMSAYLSVLVEEFSRHYLDIAMLQNYQDKVADRRRVLFTDIMLDGGLEGSDDPRILFLQNTEAHLEKIDVPEPLTVVWEAMGRLDYVWDFIADLRDEKGKSSRYQTFFVDHHFHCLRLLRDKDNDRNERICRRVNFKDYLSELDRLAEKKKSDKPITKHDSLTRMVMEKGLKFDFETMALRKK